MKFYLIVVLAIGALVAGEIDQELQARYQTMESSEFLRTFNERNLSWKMKQYNNNNINLIIIITIYNQGNADVPVHQHKLNQQLPDVFDARDKWPECPTIGEIYQQYSCGSCWTHGVANTASDRICIHRNETVVLSEQDLECAHVHQSICYGGDPLQGFKFWKHHGLVSRECKPYEPLDLDRNVCSRTCRYNSSFKNYMSKKHYAEKIYIVPDDEYQIKAELFNNGPIQAMMPIYEDFKDADGHGYSSGIYEHTFGELQGYHSVRVIGYGVENGVDYWLVANSWGKDWGENGLFRIKRFQEHLLKDGVGFEKQLFAGLPKTEKQGLL